MGAVGCSDWLDGLRGIIVIGATLLFPFRYGARRKGWRCQRPAPKSPCGPSPIEKFTATPANVDTTKSQNPQRLHLSKAIAEITLMTPAIARAQKAQSGIR